MSSGMYSFSSQPKAVSGTRKKYREPDATDTALFRDLKETCITWDKRVHRGNTYSMYTQNAIKEALKEAVSPTQPAPRRRRRPQEKSIFDMGLPEHERVPVDLTKHLVASSESEVVKVDVADTQTDEFVPLPPPEPFVPPKTGVDVSTQVEDGELFIFENEVEPILSVIVNKTLEQSLMEVEEEHEMARMAEFKSDWLARQQQMMKEWEALVAEEWVAWRRKQAILAQQRARKRREAQVLLKIQALAASKSHLSRVVPNAIRSMHEVAFPDAQSLAIDRLFLPSLLGEVQRLAQERRIAEHIVDETVCKQPLERIGAQKASMESQRQRARDEEAKRMDEIHIRKGRIRIHVDDGAGGKITVGPVQISQDEDIEQVEDRIKAWLQENEPELAEAWSYGVTLRINNLPIQQTSEIFLAKSGMLSMHPKDPPAPPEEEEDDDEEGE